jgi:molybdate transport system regulatory protein
MTRQALSQLQQALGHTTSDKRLEVLRLIGQSGSISEAARQAGISYKAAWQAVDTLSNLSGLQLVEKVVGGVGGGGARLTGSGQQLLALASDLDEARAQVMARFSGTGLTGRTLGMRTSMRNQVPAQVLRCERSNPSEPLCTVYLRTECHTELCSAITEESAELLGLHAGLPVLVLSKATAVQIHTNKPVQGNAVQGSIERIGVGAAKDEIVIRAASGALWVGLADTGNGMRTGQAGWACMPPSALVIGLVT